MTVFTTIDPKINVHILTSHRIWGGGAASHRLHSPNGSINNVNTFLQVPKYYGFVFSKVMTFRLVAYST